MRLVTVEEMQSIERQANQSGLSYEQMMQNAGHGLAQVIGKTYEPLKSGGCLGLVGSGNNGGDTLVALTYLVEWGWQTSAFLVRPRPDHRTVPMKRLYSSGPC